MNYVVALLAAISLAGCSTKATDTAAVRTLIQIVRPTSNIETNGLADDSECIQRVRYEQGGQTTERLDFYGQSCALGSSLRPESEIRFRLPLKAVSNSTDLQIVA